MYSGYPRKCYQFWFCGNKVCLWIQWRPGFDPWVGKIPWRRKWQPHSSILAWRIPWTEEPGGLQSTGSRRVGHDWVTSLSLWTQRLIPDHELFRWRWTSQPVKKSSISFSASPYELKEGIQEIKSQLEKKKKKELDWVLWVLFEPQIKVKAQGFILWAWTCRMRAKTKQNCMCPGLLWLSFTQFIWHNNMCLAV